MARTHYALATDVIRRFDPTLTQTDLQSDDFIGYDDLDAVQSRLEGVESTFERETEHALREVRVGAGSGSYEYHGASPLSFPLHVFLDHRNIVPLDAAAGDVLEVRTGREQWTDITAKEGDEWAMNHRLGKLTLYRYPGFGHLPTFHRINERFVRLSYRYGALGGDQNAGGETTISEQVSGGSTPTVDVADANRLPRGAYTMLLGGSEYVGAQVADPSADTVEITERGRRRTDGQQTHASGATLHYCPLAVREAIAAKTAQELVIYDDFVDRLVDTGDTIGSDKKLDEWESEWNRTVAQFSDSMGYA